MIQPDKIENHLADLNVLYVRKLGNYMHSPWQAWQVLMNFVHERNLDESKLRYFGISYDNPEVTPEDQLRYDAMIHTEEEVRERGEVHSQTIQGGKYAIFTHHGPYQDLEKTFHAIFTEWLPQSNRSFDPNRFVFSEYFHLECMKTDPSKLLTKIYIPLL